MQSARTAIRAANSGRQPVAAGPCRGGCKRAIALEHRTPRLDFSSRKQQQRMQATFATCSAASAVAAARRCVGLDLPNATLPVAPQPAQLRQLGDLRSARGPRASLALPRRVHCAAARWGLGGQAMTFASCLEPCRRRRRSRPPPALRARRLPARASSAPSRPVALPCTQACRRCGGRCAARRRALRCRGQGRRADGRGV